MKLLKYFMILLMFLGISSCNLEEDPVFLDQSIYSSPQSIKAALAGMYQQLTVYNAQERRYYIINGFSGYFSSRKNGANVNNVNNANLFSLKPQQDADSEAAWQGIYSTIAQTNATIANNSTVEIPLSNNEKLFNDVAGNAYFLRAWCYFSLTRLFGDIPLWTTLPDSENLHKAKTSSKDVYAQAIADAKQAAALMNGTNASSGFPQSYAANMLLAKLYMTLATNPELRADGLSEANYWQMAYDEAIKCYGKYSLVSDYASLFTDSNENTSESIFELQISLSAANSQMGRNYTPNAYKSTQAFGWFFVHADIYDDHVATYPGDPRIAGTYISQYTNANNGNTMKVYPSNPNRNQYTNAHPFFFKFAEKDQSNTNQYGSQNLLVYRYAELLLMLAEISNELQNGQQLGYVTEVLDRVGMTPHAGFTGTQDEFRDAIMREYRYELIGEGEDAHNSRRRGYDYFLNKIITPHNSNPNLNQHDLILNTNESEIMQLPIPAIEINTNELIN